MGLITQTYPFVAGNIPTAAEWNSNWTTVLALVNGQLDELNVDYTSADGIVTMQNTQSITGTKTFTSAVLTTADINGGTIDGATIGASSATTGAFTSVTASTTLGVTGIATFGDDVVSDTDSTDDLGTTGVRWANLWVDDVTATTGVNAGTMTIGAGSITDSSGAISFGNENLTTTGTLSAGVTTVTSLRASSNDGGAIGAGGTAFSDLFLASGAVINFGNGNALMTHSAGAFSFSGANLTTTGTLASGNLGVTGTITGSGILSIDDTTDSTSGITGSIHTDGGVGIAKKLYVGGSGTDATIQANVVGTLDTSYTGLYMPDSTRTAYQAFGQQCTSVTTSAKTIGNMTDRGGLVLVTGSDGNIFHDLVFFAVGATPVAISSVNASGSPQARTYSNSGNDLQLAMASGTYNVHASWWRNSDF